MVRCRLLILTAVLPEARALARAFSFPPPTPARVSGNDDVAVALVGIRAVRLPDLLTQVTAQSLLMAGLAGALSPRLSVGDLVVDGIGPRFLAGLQPLHMGAIHTSETIVSTPVEKAALYASTKAVAVDMEASTVAAYARHAGIPFASLRAISDAAHEPLDPRLLTLIDPLGRPRLSQVAGLLIRQPNLLPRLLTLKRRCDVALERLGAAARAVAASGWPLDVPNGQPAVTAQPS